MEQKTKINAEDGKQELAISREFDLPLELLFKAHVEPGIVEQWMGAKVLKFEGKRHGGYQFETTDPKGNKYRFNGVIHEFAPNRVIGNSIVKECCRAFHAHCCSPHLTRTSLFEGEANSRRNYEPSEVRLRHTHATPDLLAENS